MAKMLVNLPDDYIRKLNRLGSSMQKVAMEAVEEGAVPLEKAVRKQLESAISTDATGELLYSLGTTPADVDDKGVINAKVGFHGYDRNRKPTPSYPNGVPNQLKARLINSGSSVQKKNPFVKRAVRDSKKESIDIMDKYIEKKVKNIMKE